MPHRTEDADEAARSVGAPTMNGQDVAKTELFGERDHHLAEIAHVATHVAAIGLEIEDRVRHELPGPVVGDVPSPARFDHVHAGTEHVLFLRAAPERDDGIVLEQEQRVADLARDAPLHEPLLQRVRLRVRNATQPVC